MVQRDPSGGKYKYPKRTCKECSLYPCFEGIENCICDFAKYGCRTYKLKQNGAI